MRKLVILATALAIAAMGYWVGLQRASDRVAPYGLLVREWPDTALTELGDLLREMRQIRTEAQALNADWDTLQGRFRAAKTRYDSLLFVYAQ